MMRREVPDEQLVDATRRGDGAAFGELFSRYHDPLYRLCRSFARLGHDDALDVVQDSFLRAYRSLAALRQEDRFYPFLATIARRRCLTQCARAGRSRAMQDELAQQPPEAEPAVLPAEDDQFRQAAALQCVAAVIDELPAGEVKTVVTLYYREGWNSQQIAEQLGVPKSTITSRLIRFRGRIRQTLLRRLIEVRGS